jgi:acyl-CoA reductase-like NAD-dependent aldehyde dehydrogenase
LERELLVRRGKLAAALAAGCTTVIKRAELSALQTRVLLECLHEARLPPGVFNGFRDATMAPFGGCKQSGIGREYGVYGIEAYLEPRALFPLASRK